MAKIIAVNRKYLSTIIGVTLFGIFCIAVVGLLGNQTLTTNQTLTPEIKMLNVTLNPASFTKDLTYGSLTVKDAQVIPSKTFDLTATIQNMTNQTLSNVPVELEISLLGDSSQKNILPSQIESLAPGETARVTFRGVKAIGDAEGKDITAGQHQIVLRIKANSAGGVNQNSEASFRFVVDSTVKPPAQ